MSSNRIHIALPNASQYLVDTDMGDLRIGWIEGQYTKTLDVSSPKETRFAKEVQRTTIEKKVKWGQKHLAYNDAVTLQEIHDDVGPFIITRMIVQWHYTDSVVLGGIAKKLDKVTEHEFSKWPFKPGLFKRMFDRMPSFPLWNEIQKEKTKWSSSRAHVGSDPKATMEVLRRIRDVFLVNAPVVAEVPLSVYKMWYGKGAMILPETTGNFRGRELGISSEGVF